MSDFPGLIPHLPVLSTLSPESVGTEAGFVFGNVTPASAAWGTTNDAMYCPIALHAPFLVRKVWWVNGGTASGNVDVGVYSMGGARILSCGSTAQAGTTAIQSAAPSAGSVLLTPGAYYLAIALSSATGTIIQIANAARYMAANGCAQQATALPLPDPATPATVTRTNLPVFGIADVVTI